MPKGAGEYLLDALFRSSAQGSASDVAKSVALDAASDAVWDSAWDATFKSSAETKEAKGQRARVQAGRPGPAKDQPGMATVKPLTKQQYTQCKEKIAQQTIEEKLEAIDKIVNDPAIEDADKQQFLQYYIALEADNEKRAELVGALIQRHGGKIVGLMLASPYLSHGNRAAVLGNPKLTPREAEEAFVAMPQAVMPQQEKSLFSKDEERFLNGAALVILAGLMIPGAQAIAGVAVAAVLVFLLCKILAEIFEAILNLIFGKDEPKSATLASNNMSAERQGQLFSALPGQEQHQMCADTRLQFLKEEQLLGWFKTACSMQAKPAEYAVKAITQTFDTSNESKVFAGKMFNTLESPQLKAQVLLDSNMPAKTAVDLLKDQPPNVRQEIFKEMAQQSPGRYEKVAEITKACRSPHERMGLLKDMPTEMQTACKEATRPHAGAGVHQAAHVQQQQASRPTPAEVEMVDMSMPRKNR